MNRLWAFIQESRAEMAKVVWPSRQEAVRLTILVIIFSIIVAAFIGLVDEGFRVVLERLILK